MTTKERKERVARIRSAAYKIERLVAKRHDRRLDEMKDSIRENERGHQRFGRRLLGHKPTRKITIDDVVDLFVVKCILEALDAKTEPRASELLEIRADHRIGAGLAWHPDLRQPLLDLFPPDERRALIELADYSELVQ